MSYSNVDPTLAFDVQSVAKLRSEVLNSKTNDEALQKTAKQFESLFIDMMMKNMRKNSVEHGLFDTKHIEFYQEMQDKQLASEFTRGDGIGLAQSLMRQLRGQILPKSSGDSVNLSSTQPTPSGVLDVHSFKQSPDYFIEKLKPHAEKAAQELGTDPRIIVAQAALETGWGKHIMSSSDGMPSFNMFGIKADKSWSGDKAEHQTLEFEHGKFNKVKDDFRSYHSLEQSFNDYVDFLQSNPRYKTALNSQGNAAEYAQSLQNAGYATDPKYADKLMSVMNSPGFNKIWQKLDVPPNMATAEPSAKSGV